MTNFQETPIQKNPNVYNSFMSEQNVNTNREDLPMDRSQIVKLLQQFDVTPTRQRIEIAGYLFQRPQHLSAEDILEGVNAESNRVSRATIYNTLGLFTQKGLIREILIDRERVFYDTNRAAHYHVYDIDSGELHDVMDAAIELAAMPQLPEGMRVIDTDVIFRVSSKA
jgi:Fur family iron response transcriptional regulator